MTFISLIYEFQSVNQRASIMNFLSRQGARLLRSSTLQTQANIFHTSSLAAIPHKVEVRYCRGWGYGRRYELLRLRLLDAFDPSFYDGKQIVSVNGTPDDVKSGAFEVYVEGNLVHSKLKGDGFVDSDDKMDKLIEAIEELGTE